MFSFIKKLFTEADSVVAPDSKPLVSVTDGGTLKSVSVITHSGTFHTDDVFAAAIVSLYYERIKKMSISITRTRDEDLIQKADIVFDVGGIYDENKARFDHHQKGGAGSRENGIPYASAGLVWKFYGYELAFSDASLFSKIDKKVLCGVDAIDNGVDFVKPMFEYVYPYDISMFFGSMKPTWKNESPENMDRAFFEAVREAKKLLERELDAEADAREAVAVIRECFEKSKGMYWVELPYNFGFTLINRVADQYPDILYTIAPRNSRGWELLCTRVPGSFENKKPLPMAWRGQRDEDLQMATGVPDAFFCHNTGYMILADSRDGVLALMEQAHAL